MGLLLWAKDMLREHVQDWNRPAGEILAEITVPTVPNLAACPRIQRQPTLLDAIGTIAVERRAHPLNALVLEGAFARQDTLPQALDALQAAGTVTSEEAAQIAALVTEEVDDPAYRPLLSWSETHFGRDIDVGEVLEVQMEVLRAQG